MTDKFIRNLEPDGRKYRVHYDGKLRGFGICTYKSGRKSFVLNYYFKGRERRIVIGGYPEWKLLAARKQAEEYLYQVAQGDDPLEQREKAHGAPTVKDMFERYSKDYLPKLAKRSQQDQRAMFTKSILPKLGSKKVEDVTFNDCERLHRKLTEDRPIRANRVIEVLRKNFNLAIKWGWIERNPAIGIERNPETKRERFLSEDEIRRLLEALDRHTQTTSCDAIKMMLFTGCRRGEALNARWDQFDDDLRIWTKPAATTKQRRLHRVPVSALVTKMLGRRREEAETEFVFAGQSGNALTDVKKTWKAVSEAAGLDDVRLHDLRHTFASVAVSQGMSLPIIGALLGHTQTQTTARYAHLFDEPLFEAVNLVGGSMLATPKG
ncbi:tyrosine-type recombinase/integrase [Hyphomonas jannaschiana]|uniref:tyrosine-type recombinase/integrase n=1 Tax=Hyphomonas jannaschiana TaxID=86 RepID=UPI0035C6F438